MPKINLDNVPVISGSSYPAPHDTEMSGRSSLRLGDAGGLSQFGANLIILQPGAKSSLRHWHENEDEFVMVTKGHLTLVEDQGETLLAQGDCAAFPRGSANGHHLINRSDTEGRFLVVGTSSPNDECHYSDVDLHLSCSEGSDRFTRKDGSAFQEND